MLILSDVFSFDDALTLLTSMEVKRQVDGINGGVAVYLQKANKLDISTSLPIDEDEEDQDSCSWNRIPIEPTMSIHLKVN